MWGPTGLSETAKLTLKMAYDVAQEYDQEFCGTTHSIQHPDAKERSCNDPAAAI